MDWFTSDWHLGHDFTANFRGFDDTAVMDAIVVNNVFKKVRKGDNLYFMGDISFSKESAEAILKEIKRRKINFYWIVGNHDNKIMSDDFKQYCHTIASTLVIRRNHQTIHLNHMPMLTWQQSFRNSFHLYGHIHITSPELAQVEARQTGKALNVNLEFNNLEPYNLDDIFRIMEAKGNNWDYEIMKEAKGEINA